MANRYPLVRNSVGEISELPVGDNLIGVFSFTYFYASGTSTLTRTAGTFTTISGMTTSGSTPVAGTYIVFFRADIEVGTLNGQGETAVFVGGTQVTALTADIELEVALLLGLIGTARVRTGAEILIGVVTVNGSQDIDIQYRSVDGQTVTITNRSFLIVRVA